MNVDADASIGPLALLGWMPGAIGRLSLRLSRASAWLLGTTALTAQTLLLAAAVFGSLSEPYPTMRAEMQEVIAMLPFAFASLFVFWGLLLALSGMFVSSKHRPRSEVAAVLLSPLSTLVPGLIWSLCAGISVLGSGSNNILAGKPRWLSWMLFDYCGSMGWCLIGFFVMAANASRCCRQLRRRENSLCVNCGYSLINNTSGVCPECGTAIMPAPPAA